MSRRRKKRSLTLDRARTRSAAVQAISPSLDFGNGLTTEKFEAVIEEARQSLASYNTMLSQLDQEYQRFLDLERMVADLTERVLLGVAAQYGRNSEEYVMAGGRPKPKRRRSRKPTQDEANAIALID